MQKLTLLTIAITSFTPLNSFSANEAYTPPLGSLRKCARVHAPPLHYTAEFGGGEVFTGLTKNPPGAPIAPHLTADQDHLAGKRLCYDTPISGDQIIPFILQNPAVDFFQDAFITKTDHVHCPRSLSLLTLQELFKIIMDLKDIINPQFLLPPNAFSAHQPNTAKILVSLQSAEALLTTIPAESGFKYLTEASLQEDGHIFMPLLKRVITMDRLLVILEISEDSEYAMSTLSDDLKKRVREAWKLKLNLESTTVVNTKKRNRPHRKKS